MQRIVLQIIPTCRNLARSLFFIINDEYLRQGEQEEVSVSQSAFLKRIKTIIFIILSICVVATVTVTLFMTSLMRVFFSSLIIWRSFVLDVHIPGTLNNNKTLYFIDSNFWIPIYSQVLPFNIAMNELVASLGKFLHLEYVFTGKRLFILSTFKTH